MDLSMSSSMADDDVVFEWFEVGAVEELRTRKCRRLYTASGQDLALFCPKGDNFYVTSAICPHAKGPIDQGDIEDVGGGNYHITCPLHFYVYDLRSGVSTTGLKLPTYKTEAKNGQLFVNAPEKVFLKSANAKKKM